MTIRWNRTTQAVVGAAVAAMAASCGNQPPTPGPGAPATLTGYQLVSNSLQVGPLQTASQSATCPPGKVALVAGYSAVAAATQGVHPPEVERGLEVKKARPVWPQSGQSYAEVELRNAHVLQPAVLTVTAVCVDRRADLRIAEVTNGVTNAGIANPRGRHPLGCDAGEVVVGGGAAVPLQGHLKINAPRADGQVWDAEAFHDKPAPTLTLTTTVVCADAARVAGLQIVSSGPTSLAGLGQTQQSLRCSARAKVLAAGLGDSSGLTGIDMIPVLLDIGGTGGSGPGWVESKVHNRNLIGAPSSVVVQTTAICAETA